MRGLVSGSLRYAPYSTETRGYFANNDHQIKGGDFPVTGC